MKLVVVLWIICAVLALGSSFLRYKMIYILEENGFSISKFSSYITVLNKFTLMNNQHRIKKLRPKRMNLFIKAAYISYYLAIVILLVVILSIFLTV